MPFNSAQLLILSCILCLLISVSKKMSNSLSQNYLNKTLTPGGGILVRELSEQLFNNLYCKGKVWSTISAVLFIFNVLFPWLYLVVLLRSTWNRKLLVQVFNPVNYPSNAIPFQMQSILNFKKQFFADFQMQSIFTFFENCFCSCRASQIFQRCVLVLSKRWIMLMTRMNRQISQKCKRLRHLWIVYRQNCRKNALRPKCHYPWVKMGR